MKYIEMLNNETLQLGLNMNKKAIKFNNHNPIRQLVVQISDIESIKKYICKGYLTERNSSL